MWREKLREVDAIACAIDASAVSGAAVGAGDTVGQLTRTLATHLDDDEPLVAYAALRHLEQRVVSKFQPHHHELLAELLLTSTSTPAHHQWTASSGYRFQLLRALIQTNSGASDTSDSEDSGEDDDDGESAAATTTSPSSHPGLRAVLKHSALLQAIAIDLLHEEVKGESSAHSVHSLLTYELLGFLTVLTEQLTTIAESIEDDEGKEMAMMEDLSGFYKLVTTMFRIFTGTTEYASQPTYVACAVVGFLHQFLRFQSASSSASGDSCTKIEWQQRYLDLLVAERCPLTKLAMELLHEQEPSETSSQASLISSESRFPFLQSWISFASSAALVVAQGSLSFAVSVSTAINSSSVRCRLPDRATLLAVLSEQDDVMVEVLHTLLQLTALVESHRRQEAPSQEVDSRSSKSVAWLVEYLLEQLDPDLLFADILCTFGHDHLILLDLLISSETVMLEYLLRYLRRLGSNWEASRAVLCRQSSDSQTLDAVLSVLIRLRFEIDKQETAGMFPYNAAPLLRRLVHVEELYEMA